MPEPLTPERITQIIRSATMLLLKQDVWAVDVRLTMGELLSATQSLAAEVERLREELEASDNYAAFERLAAEVERLSVENRKLNHILAHQSPGGVLQLMRQLAAAEAERDRLAAENAELREALVKIASPIEALHHTETYDGPIREISPHLRTAYQDALITIRELLARTQPTASETPAKGGDV